MSSTQLRTRTDQPLPADSRESQAHPRGRRERRPRRRLHAFFALIAAMVVAVGVLALPPGTAAPATAPVTVHADVRTDESSRIDAFVTERMEAHRIPGAAVAVVRGGEVVHLAGYGIADPTDRQVTADTPFLIGSVSKPFTATAVLQLVEDGRLSMDEPVLPHLAHLAEQVPDGFASVTVEHLLTHTGGLAFVPGTAGTGPVLNGDDAVQHRAADVLAAASSFPGNLGAVPPGERFSYSNGGYILLAAVIEEVTGRTYADHMQDAVFAPLGMTRSFADGTADAAGELATGHSPWFGRWRPRELPYDQAGAPMGYIGSTARDLTQFMNAHLGTEHQDVVGPELRADAHRQAVPDGHTGDPMQAGYGMGWFTGELADRPTVSHSGSLGHFATHLNLVPQADRLGVAVLTNASAVAAGQGADHHLGTDVTRLLLGGDVGPADPSVLTTVVLPLVVWGAAAGVLVAAARFLTVRLPRLRRSGRPSRSGWLRHVVLPSAGFLAVAVPLLTVAPLGLARHMVPDAGWGLTVLAHLALGWAVLRALLAVLALRRGGH